jgi:RHS repeat-associated protein
MSVAGMHGAGGIGGLLACREILNPPALVGDLDADHDVDQTDYSLLEACWTGPNVPLANTACGYADLNGDNMVDLADLAVMQPNLLAGAKAATERDNWYFYDGNGNVGQLVTYAPLAGTVTLAAAYEYDPYGNTLAINQITSNSDVAFTNPFRFSTKWFDADTGLYYYGYRYYSPRLGRWISRDPLNETSVFAAIQSPRRTTSVQRDSRGSSPHAPVISWEAEYHLYSYVHNRVADSVDILGLDRYIVGGWGEGGHRGICVDVWESVPPKMCCTKGPYAGKERMCLQVTGQRCFDFRTHVSSYWAIINFFPSILVGAGDVNETDNMAGRRTEVTLKTRCKEDRELLYKLRDQVANPDLYT